jgi:hypothetical protein
MHTFNATQNLTALLKREMGAMTVEELFLVF